MNLAESDSHMPLAQLTVTSTRLLSTTDSDHDNSPIITHHCDLVHGWTASVNMGSQNTTVRCMNEVGVYRKALDNA